MRVAVVAPLVLVWLAPSVGAAQVLQSTQDLALRVNLEDRIRIEDGSGVRTTGRLTRLTPDEITIQTEAGEQRVGSDTVREVAVRGHAMRKGALIGAGVFAVLGVIANCSHEGGAGCAFIGSLGAAPIGAGVGLAVGALVPGMRTIYRAPDIGAPVTQPRAALVGQRGLLDDLAPRVNLDDDLRVEDRSGARITGRLTGLTVDEMTIRTSAGEKHFTRDALRQVAVRRQPLRAGVLIGAGVGAVAGAVAACTGADREECVDAPIMAGALGAGVGLAVAAPIHRTTIVYPTPEQRAFVLPVVSPGAAGVRVSLRWR